MFGLPIAFSAPWLLLALGVLPILWFLLRAVPPAPIRRRFPGVALLLGLNDEDSVVDRTPWWLLLLRMLAAAAAIIGFAGPVLNPESEDPSDKPLLVVLDGGWASAASWRTDSAALVTVLENAGRSGREAAIVQVTSPNAPQFLPAIATAQTLPKFAPLVWQPTGQNIEALIGNLGDEEFDSLWVSDGLDYEGRHRMLDVLTARGDLQVVQSGSQVSGISDVVFQDGVLKVIAQSSHQDTPEQLVGIIGTDPNGVEIALARGAIRYDSGSQQGVAEFSLPSEIRSRITRIEIEGVETAGATYLTGDRLKRREIGIVTVRDSREGLQLLSPTHYLRQAMVETADVIEGAILDIMPARPDVLVLADISTLAPTEEQSIQDWVEAGGILLRFAGPQMAASDLSRGDEHPLMPVRLRAGGRTVGGAMSWGEPKALAPFSIDSPFYGLQVPEDLRVTAQVLAQPDPNLADRVLAELSDGTPLVTRKIVGQGQVVLFHVTANAEWSGLPLSGLFVQMLDRLAILSAVSETEASVLEGTIWQPIKVLTASGRLEDGLTFPGVAGEALVDDPIGPSLRPGLYHSNDTNRVRNVLAPEDTLDAFEWPADVEVQGLSAPESKDLMGVLLAAALILLMVDTLASLALSGRLQGFGIAASVMAALLIPQGGEAQAQPTNELTDEIALGYVVTGDRELDQLSFNGLFGLSDVLFQRTSVEPVNPIGVNLETDELAFFPFLYWPIATGQPLPSDVAYGKLNRYLRSGGMILFDTRDADVARRGSASPNGRKLQQIARGLDIPALEPVPADHVLTRTFYLLKDFPGRYRGRNVWAEAAPPDAEQVEGMPFRNLNDGVTPVIIGGNDWASAWATNSRGTPLYPVGRGATGERQRELAYRFGINLIMHVLTGNYKSDQVHVPALLDRLGQ